MCKLCWALLLLAVIVNGGLVYKFFIAGETLVASDDRQSLRLEPGERDMVLGEMRMFLKATRQIVQSATEDDAKGIARAASSVGRAAQQAVPGSLMKKLPLEFKTLGLDTHAKFDQLALDAESFGDSATSLKQLATLLQNCVACHEAYRIDAATMQ